MRRVKLTSEWLASWRPKCQEEVVDGVCRGLLVRSGPTGIKAFYAWAHVRDLQTGTMRRSRAFVRHLGNGFPLSAHGPLVRPVLGEHATWLPKSQHGVTTRPCCGYLRSSNWRDEG